MNGNYLLDTNVFINAFRNGVKLPSARYAYSVITELELLSFPELTSEDELAISSFLSRMAKITLSDDIQRETIRVRRSTRMKLPDSIISASAVVISASLVTDDAKLAAQHEGNVVSLYELVSF